MGFLVTAQEEQLQEKAVKGQYQKVAVGCWYTSSGRSIPMMIKFEDSEGCLQEIRDIRVIKFEKKYYAGILLQRFECSSTVEDREYMFTLLYHSDSGIWDLVFM